jgi:hypothetical protein
MRQTDGDHVYKFRFFQLSTDTNALTTLIRLHNCRKIATSLRKTCDGHHQVFFLPPSKKTRPCLLIDSSPSIENSWQPLS